MAEPSDDQFRQSESERQILSQTDLLSSDSIPQRNLTVKRQALFWLIYIVGCVFLPILVLEILLRATLGPPTGALSFLLSSKAGLYPPKSEIHLSFGPIPYTVVSNSFGIRGPEFSITPPRSIQRIACIGDSITDGFFVNNEETYPRFLEKYLRSLGYSCEVISVAKGGCSIDLELARLREIAVPLKPSLVILVFVSNDIYELRGKSRDEIINSRIKLGGWESLMKSALARSKLAELLFEKYVSYAKFRIPHPSRNQAEQVNVNRGSDDTQTSGSLNFLENVRIFWQRYSEKDGIVHVDRLSSSTQALLNLYFDGLQEFARVCHDNKIEFCFVYYPSYPQVYDRKTPMTIRDLLQEFCAKHHIRFIDLTEAYRRRPTDRPFEYAPIDFHPNPRGNEFLAQAIANELIKKELIRKSADGNDSDTTH